MSIVIELQKRALNEKSLPALLRQALLVARKLGVNEFSDWIKKELSGYKNEDEIPEYRKVTGELKQLNPYRGWQTVLFHDQITSEACTKTSIIQSISEVEELSNAESDSLMMIIKPEDKLKIQEALSYNLDIGIFISRTVATKVCDAVKTIVLEWAIRLEEQGILGGDAMFSSDEKTKAQESPTINIENFLGILGNVSKSQVNQSLSLTIKNNNFEDLKKALLKEGVSEEDINALGEAIKLDPKPISSKNFGVKVSEWVGGMIGKAASGVWDISTTVAAEILTKALWQYYG